MMWHDVSNSLEKQEAYKLEWAITLSKLKFSAL